MTLYVFGRAFCTFTDRKYEYNRRLLLLYLITRLVLLVWLDDWKGLAQGDEPQAQLAAVQQAVAGAAHLAAERQGVSLPQEVQGLDTARHRADCPVRQGMTRTTFSISHPSPVVRWRGWAAPLAVSHPGVDALGQPESANCSNTAPLLPTEKKGGVLSKLAGVFSGSSAPRPANRGGVRRPAGFRARAPAPAPASRVSFGGARGGVRRPGQVGGVWSTGGGRGRGVAGGRPARGPPVVGQVRERVCVYVCGVFSLLVMHSNATNQTTSLSGWKRGWWWGV